MKKHEVLKYCKEKSEEGWMTHTMLLEIFNDDEEIPDDLIELICYKPEPPKPFIILMGSVGIFHMNKVFEDYERYLTHKDIMEDFKKQYKS